MPALRWCGRRWMTGSDDFVVGGGAYALAHAVLGITALWLANHRVADECVGDDGTSVKTSVTLVGCVNVISSGIFLILAFASSRGSVFQTSRRAAVPAVLYMASLTVVGLIIADSIAIHRIITEHDAESCQLNDANEKVHGEGGRLGLIHGIYAIVVLDMILPLLALCVMMLHFDCAGGKEYTDFDQYEHLWEKRCSVLCCCCLSGPAAEDALMEAARTMAMLFRGHDIVPSDIYAGMVLLNSFQKRQYRQKLLGLSQDSSSPTTLGAVSRKSRAKASTQARNFAKWSDDQRSKLRDLQYYSRYFLGAYGHLLYWYMNLATGPLKLCASDCTMCCRSRPGEHIGDCCFCDNTALQKVAKLTDDDIVMTHFKNELYYPSFYVAIDRQRDEVIIAVRGTMSLQDCITDVVAAPEALSLANCPDAYVHSGMLKSATNIANALHQYMVMDDIISGSFKAKNVVVLGHSLGAGAATILAILLHERFPDLRPRLRCIAYAPPGGLLSANLAAYCSSFVLGCLAGKDLVPRMAQHTMDNFRDSMLRALAASHRTKTTILCHCCCPPSDHTLLPDDLTEDTERGRMVRDAQEGPVSPHSHLRTVRLYPPQEMVHYTKVYSEEPCGCPTPTICHKRHFCPTWINTDELQEVQCSPYMAADHFPDRLFDVIQRTGDALDRGELDDFLDDSVDFCAAHPVNVSMTYEPKGSPSGMTGKVSYDSI